jgi:hypothetical protein
MEVVLLVLCLYAISLPFLRSAKMTFLPCSYNHFLRLTTQDSHLTLSAFCERFKTVHLIKFLYSPFLTTQFYDTYYVLLFVLGTYIYIFSICVHFERVPCNTYHLKKYIS